MNHAIDHDLHTIAEFGWSARNVSLVNLFEPAMSKILRVNLPLIRWRGIQSSLRQRSKIKILPCMKITTNFAKQESSIGSSLLCCELFHSMLIGPM